MSELRTTSDVIDALGGNQAVSELTGLNNAAAISNWRSSEEFPAWSYLSMTRALTQIGKSAPETLWKMRPQASRKRVEAT